MINTITKNINIPGEALIFYDTDLLSSLISTNSKKIDEDIKELKEFSDRLSKELSKRTIGL